MPTTSMYFHSKRPKSIRAVGGEIPGLYPVKSADQTVAQACDLLIVEIWELNSTVQRILGTML